MFFNKIRSLKCLFNSIIFKSNFIKGEKKMKRSKRNRERKTRRNLMKRKKDREWKEWKNENNVKGGNEEDLERSNISGLFFMNKSREF